MPIPMTYCLTFPVGGSMCMCCSWILVYWKIAGQGFLNRYLERLSARYVPAI